MGLHSGTTVDRRPMSKLKITEKRLRQGKTKKSNEKVGKVLR